MISIHFQKILKNISSYTNYKYDILNMIIIMNGYKIVDNVLIAIGLAFAISDIESILGIIILIVQLVWILAKAVIRIYHAVKEKNEKEAMDSLKDLSEDLTDLKKTLPNEMKKEGDDDDEQHS